MARWSIGWPGGAGSRTPTPPTSCRTSSARSPAAIERYDPDPARGSFRGWLSTIARNLIVNLLDAQRRHPRGTGDTEVRRLLEEQPAPDSQQSALFDAEYRLRVLDWAAERVRDEFTEAVWQAFWKTGVEGRPAQDAARALGLSVGTVYQYKSRVVARIRREVERVGVAVRVVAHRRPQRGAFRWSSDRSNATRTGCGPTWTTS